MFNFRYLVFPSRKEEQNETTRTLQFLSFSQDEHRSPDVGSFKLVNGYFLRRKIKRNEKCKKTVHFTDL